MEIFPMSRFRTLLNVKVVFEAVRPSNCLRIAAHIENFRGGYPSRNERDVYQGDNVNPLCLGHSEMNLLGVSLVVREKLNFCFVIKHVGLLRKLG